MACSLNALCSSEYSTHTHHYKQQMDTGPFSSISLPLLLIFSFAISVLAERMCVCVCAPVDIGLHAQHYLTKNRRLSSNIISYSVVTALIRLITFQMKNCKLKWFTAWNIKEHTSSWNAIWYFPQCYHNEFQLVQSTIRKIIERYCMCC